MKTRMHRTGITPFDLAMHWLCTCGHNLVLLTKLKARAAHLAYAASALDHGWSHAVLGAVVCTRVGQRAGKALVGRTGGVSCTS